MNKYSTFEIENLFTRQVRDLTRRTLGGKEQQRSQIQARTNFKQTSLDEFKTKKSSGLPVVYPYKPSLQRGVKTFPKGTPEDYEYDEEAEESRDTAGLSMSG
jgi:hypothetical protein